MTIVDSPASPVMIGGLAQMAQDLAKVPLQLRHRGVLARPTDLTGKALLVRGLVVKVKRHDTPWNYYTITDKGYDLLRREDLHP